MTALEHDWILIGERIQMHIAIDSKPKRRKRKTIIPTTTRSIHILYEESATKDGKNYSTTHQVDYDADDDHASFQLLFNTKERTRSVTQ